jgi:RimJ/RimL family protein N-acetyltransferase
MSQPDLSIRELGASDLAAYKALRDHALAHHEEAFTSDAATEAKRNAESYASRLGVGGGAGDGSITLGAFRGDALVGAISLEREARIKVRHVGHIIGTMVHASEMRRGVGGALLDALIARAAADAELQQLTLAVTAGNGPAETLYARAGFVVYGTLPRAIRIGSRYLDKRHMALTLR